MSDSGSTTNDIKQQQDEPNLESPPNEASSAASGIEIDEPKPVTTPSKRTPYKRVSAVERAQRESEALVKTLGGSLDIEGGRKTRSSTRGSTSRATVVDTPPPAKRTRAASGTPRRGRGRKLDTSFDNDSKTSPQKEDGEDDAAKKDENETVDSGKAKEEKSTDGNDQAESTEATTAKADKTQLSAKDDDKPEPMEVDGGEKIEELSTDEKKQDATAPDSTQTTIDTSSEKSPNEVNANALDSTAPASAVAVASPAAASTSASIKILGSNKDTAIEDKESLNDVQGDEAKELKEDVKISPSADNKKPIENSAGNSVKANDSQDNANSLPAGVSSPQPPPPLVPVTGNDHKAETNNFCEPKIASPPIDSNNEGTTPQYCK